MRKTERQLGVIAEDNTLHYLSAALSFSVFSTG